MVSQEIEDWSTARLLVTASRMLEHTWELLLREHGVTHAGYTILEECLIDGAQPQRKLARSCRVTDQTISRTIERLERKDLVSRATDPSDERRQLVSITEAGRQVYARVVADVRESDALSDAVADSAELRKLLLRMIGKFESAEPAELSKARDVAAHKPAV
ncbi:MarR family winged helix-turn-helix transcriptional regulator [Tomitella biformata]|uniref:MarR family winged helix-turn-helix transcriptional regulator n=1 Tax=Tomitella biformata TaxID=630403 RepID=UPI000467B11E|nr:MarR family winged helix-turn-helix transcriptional regulator [Tomitella biformata]